MKVARVVNGEFSGIWDGQEVDMVEWFPVEQLIPTFDPATQRLDGPTFQVAPDKVTETYSVVDLSADELGDIQRDALINQIGAANLLKMVIDLVSGDATALAANQATISAAQSAVTAGLGKGSQIK